MSLALPALLAACGDSGPGVPLQTALNGDAGLASSTATPGNDGGVAPPSSDGGAPAVGSDPAAGGSEACDDGVCATGSTFPPIGAPVSPEDAGAVTTDPSGTSAPRTDLTRGTMLGATVRGLVHSTAQDTDAVYFSTVDVQATPDHLWRIAKTGGAPQSLYEMPTYGIDSIAMGTSGVFVLVNDSSASTILLVPKGGGATSTVLQGRNPATSLIVDGDQLTWIERDPGSAHGEILFTMPTNGTSPTARYQSDQASIQFLVGLGGGSLGWHDSGDGALHRQAQVSGTVEGFAPQVMDIRATAGRDGALFWLHAGDGSTRGNLGAWSPDGVTNEALLATPEVDFGSFQSLAIDDSRVYWSRAGAPFVAPSAGGAATQLGSPAVNPLDNSCNPTGVSDDVRGLQVDATTLFSFEHYLDCTGAHAYVRAFAK